MITDTKLLARNRGGRPPKQIKRDKLLGVRCSSIEQVLIKSHAKGSGLTISEYLRNLGLNGKIDRPKMRFPKEILQFTGTLNHLAANLNQIAKKRNQSDELNAIERAQLNQLSLSVKQLTSDIKNYLR
jgi:hypothetical protein